MSAATSLIFPYGDVSDSELATLLEGALCDRISCEDLTERSRELRTGGTKTGDTAAKAAAAFGFGVQSEGDSHDYLAWDDQDDWDAGPGCRDLPLRFATAESARVWCEVTEEQEHRTRHRRWRDRYDRWLPRKSRYDRRVQALKDAGLWTQEDERMSPLLMPAGPGHEPQRGGGQTTRYRIVPDAEMDTPVLDWWLEDR